MGSLRGTPLPGGQSAAHICPSSLQQWELSGHRQRKQSLADQVEGSFWAGCGASRPPRKPSRGASWGQTAQTGQAAPENECISNRFSTLEPTRGSRPRDRAQLSGVGRERGKDRGLSGSQLFPQWRAHTGVPPAVKTAFQGGVPQGSQGLLGRRNGGPETTMSPPAVSSGKGVLPLSLEWPSHGPASPFSPLEPGLTQPRFQKGLPEGDTVSLSRAFKLNNPASPPSPSPV